MKVITKDGIYSDFALFVEIDDAMLKEIEGNVGVVKDFDFMRRAIDSNGNNAHIVNLNALNVKDIMGQGREGVLSKYDSVSWVHNGKFIIKRGLSNE